MTTKTRRPEPPAPVRLVPSGPPGVWSACGDRFTVTRYRAPKGATLDEREWAANGALDVVDHHRRDVLGHPGTNTARVYEQADAVSLIARVLRVEHADAVRRYEARQAVRS